MLNGNNVHTLFDDIDNLLKDLCEFLSENIKDGSISERHKKLAQQLVDRSKKQLQNISVVTATLSKPEADEDESYVDMTPTKGPPIEEPAPLVQLRHPIIEETRVCPYILHSIHEIKDFEMAGYLDKKGKLWFLDHQIKQFIVIKDGWLMLYSNENDKKPSEVIDLRRSMVKHVDHFKDGASQRDNRTFQLVTDTKTLQFMGKNTKDMEQWVNIISKSSKYEPEPTTEENRLEQKSEPPPTKLAGKFSRKELPPEPVPGIQNKYTPRYPETKPRISDAMDNYDPVTITDAPTDEEDTAENIYESPQLLTVKMHDTANLKIKLRSESPPPLPPYIIRRDKSPQPKPPQRIEQNIEPPAPPAIIRDKPKPFGPTKEVAIFRDSFSDDDEVEYDVPLNEKEDIVKPPKMANIDKEGYIKKQSMIVIQQTQDDEDETYDEVNHVEVEENVKPPALPKPPAIIRDKPKPFGPPKEVTIFTGSSFSDDEDIEYDVPLKEEPRKITTVDKEGYIKKKPAIFVQPSQDDEDETYDEVIHPEFEVKKPVPKIAGFKPNTLPKVAKIAPPRAPKPSLPIRRSSVTKRTVF